MLVWRLVNFEQDSLVYCPRLLCWRTVGAKEIYSNTKSKSGKLDIGKLTSDLKALGKDTLSFETAEELGKWILDQTKPNDVVVCMSNGDLGGVDKVAVTLISITNSNN